MEPTQDPNTVKCDPKWLDKGRKASTVGQNVNQFGLKKNDVLLTINNIPIGNVSGIYNLYKDETIKTYFVEIKRMNKLIMIEWYK